MTAAAMEPTILRNLLLFGRILRAAGISVSPDQSRSFSQALIWVDVGDRDQVFHTARSLLVHRQEDLALFEVIFNRFWRRAGGTGGSRGQGLPSPRSRTPRQPRPVEVLSFVGGKLKADATEVDVVDKSGTFSPHEVLQRKDFSDMTNEELTDVRRLIAETRWKASLRRTRRLVPDNRGSRLHLRRMMREAAKHGGAMIDLAHLSRKIKQRPMVLLADVSGSMERYTRILLQFFYGMSHSLQRVESFVFGTRLTRLTSEMRLRNIDRALEAASNQVVDWSGGTRIGESLRAFNQIWSRRVLRRGAVVILISDGWERGDVATLRREMRYLAHRCHRLVWLNPRLGSPSYRPLVHGMSAALPFVDDFLPIHNLESLQALSDHLVSLPDRRPLRSAPPATSLPATTGGSQA